MSNFTQQLKAILKPLSKKSVSKSTELETMPSGAVQDAKTPVSNPYLNAKAEWLERYGDYISQAHNWRLIAICTLGICFLSIICNVIQASQFKVLPYVVAVDEVGNVHSAGVAKGLQPGEVPKPVIQSELANYISNWRSVTADADLQGRMLTKLIAFSAGSTRTYLQNWFNSNNPYKRAENVLVSVELKGLPQQVSQNAWRVEWTETVRDRTGKIQEQTKFEATLTVGIMSPETEAEIVQNPLGIIVADIYFSKLLQQ